MKPQSLIKHCHCTCFHSFSLSPTAALARCPWEEELLLLHFKNGSWGLPMPCGGCFSLCFPFSWLARGQYGFVTHSCLSVCYIFANEYIYINEFLREHDLDRTALCLCIQTVQAVVISETSCITMYITWAWMWVSLDGLTGIGIFIVWECIFIIGDLYI